MDGESQLEHLSSLGIDDRLTQVGSVDLIMMEGGLLVGLHSKADRAAILARSIEFDVRACDPYGDGEASH